MHWILALVIAILSLSWIGNRLPSGVHSWAQSDRYAVAKQFLSHDDFFEPRTFDLSSEDGKVGVEFPLIQYISARIAEITSPQLLPFIYRALSGLVFLLGLLIFLDAQSMKSWAKAILLLLLLSPLIWFYQFNFLPDISSAGFIFLGFASLQKYFKKSELRFAIYCVLFTGLATLIKTSSGVFFIAFSISICWKILNDQQLKSLLKIIPIILCSMMLIVAYDYYFFYDLNRRLWSQVFMSKSNPILSWGEFVSVWKNMKVWRYDQWSIWQFVTLLLLVFSSLGLKGFWTKKIFANWLFRTLILSGLGVLCFFVLIGQQFSNHDYYFICTFYPLFAWFLTLVYGKILAVAFRFKQVLIFVLIAFGIANTFVGIAHTTARFEDNYAIKDRVIINETTFMKDAAAELDSVGLNRGISMFVLYEFGPNTTLIYFDRKGKVFNHEEMSRAGDYFITWFNKLNPEAIAIRKTWLSHLKRDQPWVFQHLGNQKEIKSFYIYKVNHGY
jgi:hypothetical protein